MSMDNVHHLEGALLKSGVFRVYLYNIFTKPLPTAEVRGSSAYIQVGDSEDAPKLFLAPGKVGNVLETSLGKNLKLPVTITLYLRFQGAKPNARPEVFTFPFSQYVEENAPAEPPIPLDTRLLIFFIYFCTFLGGAVCLLIVKDRMATQTERRLAADGNPQGTIAPRRSFKLSEIVLLWRLHRKCFPRSALRVSFVALCVLTLSWLVFGLSILGRIDLQ